MQLYLFIALLVLCFYQDVRFRGIHWVVFPLLLIGSFWINEAWLWIDVLSNVGFLVGSLLALTVYLTLKEGRLVNITKGYFSWGDILFLLALAPLFAFRGYLIFFTFGTCLTLLMHIVASMIKRQKTIPYAGYMAIVGIGFLVFQEQIQNYLSAW